MNILKVKIITPEKLAYESEVTELYVPTPLGRIGILPLHTPLIAGLQEGEVTVKKDQTHLRFTISGGILEVKAPSRVSGNLITQAVVLANSIDVS